MNIGIVGAGILGRLFALACMHKGWQVTLFDKEARSSTNNCSYAAAGMLAPCSEMADHPDPAIYHWGLQSINRWAEIIKLLPSSVYFQQAGSLCVAHTKDLPELKRFQANLQRHLPDNKQMTVMNTSELQQLEPDLPAEFAQGLFLSSEAQIAPFEIMQALENYLLQQKVVWHENCEVLTIEAFTIKTAATATIKQVPLSQYSGRGVRGEGSSDRFNSVLSPKTYKFDWVIDSRGLGAKSDLPTLRGVRGELLWLYAPGVKFTRPIRLLHPRYPIYVVPRPKNIYVVGATQIESEDFSAISVQSMLELLSAIYSLHKGFVEARIIKTITQCRPAFPDNLPQINVQAGLVQVNGLFRHGYLVAPTLVDEALRRL
ncbi:FAD-dependent oxidoreductase [soil metagenome]